jgi:hypothetical protein
LHPAVFSGCTAFQGPPACTDPAPSRLGRDDACALFPVRCPTCAQLWHQPPLKACRAWTLTHAEASLKQHHPSPQTGLQLCIKFSAFPLKTATCTTAMQPLRGAGTNPVRPRHGPVNAHGKSHPEVASFLHRSIEQPCG